MTISIREVLEEVGREIGKREEVYPRWIEQGKISAELAEKRLARMRAAYTYLQQMKEQETPSLFPTTPRLGKESE